MAWTKGTSGNPHGRPRQQVGAAARVSAMINDATQGGRELLDELLRMLRDPAHTTADKNRKLKVIEILLARWAGQPLAQIDVTTTRSDEPAAELRVLTDDELATIEATLRAAAERLPAVHQILERRRALVPGMTDEEAIRQYLAHMARQKDFRGIVEFATWTALLAQHHVLGCDPFPFAADARKHAMALLRMDLKAPHIGDMLYHARMCAFAAANAHYDPEGVRASQCDWLRVRHAQILERRRALVPRSRAVRDAAARFAQRILESTDGGEELLAGLLEDLRRPCHTPADYARRMRVRELLLERAYGRAVERVDLVTSTDERPSLAAMSDEALAELDAVMSRHLAAAGDEPVHQTAAARGAFDPAMACASPILHDVVGCDCAELEAPPAPTTLSARRVVAFRVDRLGRGRSPVVEVYHVYPDVGPPGTPNRGPYCVDRVKVLAPHVEAFLELLVSRGAVPLSEVDAWPTGSVPTGWTRTGSSAPSPSPASGPRAQPPPSPRQRQCGHSANRSSAVDRRGARCVDG